MAAAGGAWAQQDAGSVAISFLPPPLERATYSVGIYEAKGGKLVRRLHEAAAQSVFAVGLNGLITKWDRKDDAGKTVPPGKYAARGYAVGPLKVEGVAIHGNDWVEEDASLRIKRVESIALVPADNGLVALARMADNHLELLRFSGGEESKLLWHKTVTGFVADGQPWLQCDGENLFVFPRLPSASRKDDKVASIGVYQVSDGAAKKTAAPPAADALPLETAPPSTIETSPELNVPALDFRARVETSTDAAHGYTARSVDGTIWRVEPWRGVANSQIARSSGKDGSVWLAEGSAGLTQRVSSGDTLRQLAVMPGEPPPSAVSASTKEDRLYLLEEKPGWQRVRGLSWVDSKEEGGKMVSTWETFFERNIRAPDPALDLEDPATAKEPSPVVEITLVENELSPGKSPKARLRADFDDKGSYLAAADGLCLRKIGERANLRAVKLAKGKAAGSLSFFQCDGAAWDEFSIEGANQLMSFDAGEFELTATGEKPADAKPPEPDF
jgi:hypothetical protein